MSENGAGYGKVQPTTEMYFYEVKSCKMVLPDVGQCDAWRVHRLFAHGVKSPCVAVFLSKHHAEQYADYLMRTRTDVVCGG